MVSLRRKWSVAVAAGVMGFAVNLHPLHVDVGVLKVSFLAGLMFPLFVTLAWGWRWGLVSALAGGAQTMWLLWRGDGWGIIYSVPVFTLWIVWHGWCSDRRKTCGSVLWSMYLVEIPFRFVSTALFYTLFVWLVSFNPPPWAPDVTVAVVSPDFLKTIAVKHTVFGYLFLMTADSLLAIPPIRRVLGLPGRGQEKLRVAVLTGMALLGVAFWFLSAVISFIWDPHSLNFMQVLILDVPVDQMLTRAAVLGLCILLGLVMSRAVGNFVDTHTRDAEVVRRSEKLFRTLFDESASENYLIDMETGLFEDASKEACRALGYTREELRTMTVADVDPDFHDDNHKGRYWKRLPDEGHLAFEARHKRRDGSVYPVIVHTAIVETEGRNLQVAASYDITDIRESEKALQALNAELEERVQERTAQLEAVNHELEAFAYSVSHDLKAPLRAVDGFGLALEEDFAQDLPEEARGYLTRMRSASRRMGALIESLRALSRLTRNAMDITDVDLTVMARAVVRELEAGSPGTKIQWNIQKGLSARCDSRLIRTVLENLLGNAFKFTSDTQKAEISFSADVQNGKVVFSVCD
ncbi:MAG: PAS domain S-box protein, partial [Synergistota bacterium]|nr:PAS domain S-box protein [Synergistota bacterium]